MAKINIDTVNAVYALMVRAASATKVASDATKAVNDQRLGAYALYVKAAIAAKSVEVFVTASDMLFSEIRRTGTANGAPIGATKAKGEDAEGFNIPMSISSAKSYMQKALACGVALQEPGKGKDKKLVDRSFTAIRKDVMELTQAEKAKLEAERLEKVGGVEKTRATDGRRILAELASVIEAEENEKDLADLIQRVSDAMRDYGYVEQQEPVAELVQAAAEKAPRKVRSRKAAENRATA